MRYRFFVGGLLSLALVSGAAAPFGVYAQYRGGEMVSQEEYYQWLQNSNSSISKKIKRLDEDPVKILPMPILFGVSPSSISPNFGDPRSGGRTHEGEDIMAPKGAPIVSPTDAVVLDTGTWEGGGKYVSTANPGGEKFVYMHLDWIADINSGDTLKPGDLIGYVGNTGNAAGGAPHLHFEIRKNGPTDPYPRLKGEFTLEQKMDFVERALEDAKDEDDLTEFLVANYRSQFLAAQAMEINLPPQIDDEMKRTAKNSGGAVAAFPGDLTLGSSGSAVVTLQNFLIARNTGPAARALADAGATGNFGPITKNAVAEYQKSVGITPADGYYGPLTRAYAQQAKPAATAPASPTTPTTKPPAISSVVPARDLELGATGADVIWLQAFLINMKSGEAANALIQAGATGYFGAVTKAALVEYQKKNGISPAAGYFGPATRAFVAAKLKAA